MNTNSDAFSEDDRKKIENLFLEHRVLILESNWNQLGTHFAEDVVVMLPGEGDIVGRDQVIEWQKSFPPVSKYDVKICDLEGIGNLAYLRGEYSMAMQNPEKLEPERDTGRWIWILKRNSVGSWEIIRDIFNSMSPVT